MLFFSGPAYAICKGNNRILGRGGFGIVYKGFKIEGATKTPVCISFFSIFLFT